MSEQSEGGHTGATMGVGCLAIAPRVDDKSPQKDFEHLQDPDAWAKVIETGLGALSSVTDLQIQISGVSRELGADFDILEDYDTAYDVDFDPGPTPYSFVKFNVTVPKRMHPRMMDLFGGVECERFEFMTVYGMRGPVTLVRGREELANDNASNYVVVVREFLLAELERAGAPITLQTTGPSPFHAEFFLTPKANLDTDFAYKWSKSNLGGDEIHLFYDPAKYSPEEAYGHIAEKIVEPLSIYYRQVRARVRRLKRASIVSDLAEKLIAAHAKKGVRAWLIKTFRSGALARELQLAAITAKRLDVENRSDMNERLRAIESGADMPELTALSVKEATASYQDTLTMAQEVATALEGGRVTQYEVAVASMSTTLGAIAGAAAALITG